jgi:hypothetical protein
MPVWLYALLCVLAPMLWAVLMVRVVSRFERPPASSNRDSLPPPDYSI